MASIEPREVAVRGGTVVVRTAQPDDAAHLLEHRQRSVADTIHIVTIPSEVDADVEKRRTRIAEHLEHPGHLLLIAQPAPGAAGDQEHPPIIAELTFTCGSRSKVAHHGSFGLGADPEWRGRGVGTALITTLLDWAADHPTLEKVCLGVFSRNTRARALYQRLGFVEEGTLHRFVKHGPGDYDDDINMCIYVKDDIAPEGYNIWRRSR